MSELEFHELANLFPLLPENELKELAIDIRSRGQLDPIILYEGKILDGRNRYRACVMAGVKPKTKEHSGSNPVTFVLSKNLHRRHLTESQRAMVAAKLATMKRGDNQHTKEDGSIEPTTQAGAANMLNIGRESVKRAREVIDHGTEELQEAVEHGEVSVSAAAVVAKLPEKEQKQILTAGIEEVKRTAAEMRCKKASKSASRYESATRALCKWREKYHELGDEELEIIFQEVFRPEGD